MGGVLCSAIKSEPLNTGFISGAEVNNNVININKL